MIVNNQFDETDLSGIKPIPISERKSKLSVDQIVDPVAALGGEMPKGTGELLALLPDVLAADAV